MCPEYLFDNAFPEARTRFAALEHVYDPITRREIDGVGIGDGWRCLEAGAGSGSVARWMSGRVGPSGHVVAVDLDVRWLPSDLPDNLEVRQLDLRTEHLPAATYDLVHARLLLQHLPERRAVLAKLIDCLKPGGWLVVSEFDNLIDPCPDPTGETERLVNRVSAALIRLLHERGAETRYGLRLVQVLTAAGLVDVNLEGHLAVARGGSAGTSLMSANLRQTGRDLVARGWISEAELDRYLLALDEPELTMLMPILFTAAGRRPATAE